MHNTTDRLVDHLLEDCRHESHPGYDRRPATMGRGVKWEMAVRVVCFEVRPGTS